MPVDVREDRLELRGAGGDGAGIVEHVDIPDAGDDVGDWRAVAIVVRIVDGHPVMEGDERGSIVVVQVGRD